jgi:hypothetical protein
MSGGLGQAEGAAKAAPLTPVRLSYLYHILRRISMGEPTNAEKTILEDWKRERDELDGLISALEKRIALRSGNVGHSNSGRITSDEFFRLSTPEAIKKLLKIVGKPARSTTDIIDGLKSGGMDTNYTNVYTALGRLQKKQEVVKVGENWGLNEWYPPAPGKLKVEPILGSEIEEETEKAVETPDEAEKVGSDNQPRSGKKGRKAQVAEFIGTHGPSTRAEILAGTDIPEGTIAACLNDETKFVRGEDGKWRNVE